MQSYDARSGKIELPNKLGVMQLLAKMGGWQAPEKHEFEHGYKAQQELRQFGEDWFASARSMWGPGVLA